MCIFFEFIRNNKIFFYLYCLLAVKSAMKPTSEVLISSQPELNCIKQEPV